MFMRFRASPVSNDGRGLKRGGELMTRIRGWRRPSAMTGVD